MNKYISTIGQYSFWELDKAGIPELAKFVVYENYMHHNIYGLTSMDLSIELEQIVEEEISYYENSTIIIAKDKNSNLVGSIRVMKWNGKTSLPIVKLFGEHIIDGISKDLIWHVGRFAISSAHKHDLLLFKKLMVMAISPIFQCQDGVLFAESDAKLFRVMRALGIEVQKIGDSVQYLGSETIPTAITKRGLTSFLLNNIAKVIGITFIEDNVSDVGLPIRNYKHYDSSLCIQ